MSDIQVQMVPAGFFSRLLDEFGLQWTHLVILTGVAFSSLGLQDYLNPGLWILGIVTSFSIVYLFRNQVSTDFPKVALFSGIAVFSGLLIPLILVIYVGDDIGEFVKSWSKITTIYLSIIIGVPLGVFILSYRSQDEFLRKSLNPALTKVLKETVLERDFVSEKVCYEIDLIPTKSAKVIMRFKVLMEIENRLNSGVATYRGIFDPAGQNPEFSYAKINSTPINVKDPDKLLQRGLVLSYQTQPNEKFKVEVCGESTFYDRDSELVGVYSPCIYFSILIRKPPEDLHVNIQSLLHKKTETKLLETGDLFFEYSDGMLPFQGTRIFWKANS
jgi:hypothetical protein